MYWESNFIVILNVSDVHFLFLLWCSFMCIACASTQEACIMMSVSLTCFLMMHVIESRMYCYCWKQSNLEFSLCLFIVQFWRMKTTNTDVTGDSLSKWLVQYLEHQNVRFNKTEIHKIIAISKEMLHRHTIWQYLTPIVANRFREKRWHSVGRFQRNVRELSQSDWRNRRHVEQRTLLLW